MLNVRLFVSSLFVSHIVACFEMDNKKTPWLTVGLFQ